MNVPKGKEKSVKATVAQSSEKTAEFKKLPGLKIAIASSEVVPFAKTGGLADVSGALPKYLERLGHDVKVFMPRYSVVDDTKYELHYCSEIGEMDIRVGRFTRSVHVLRAKIPGTQVDAYFIDCPHYYYRRYIYTMDKDEDERYILFCKAVVETMQRLGWAADVVHCNDWQTGLIPVYLKDNYHWDRIFDHTACLYSIHNVAYQGRFSKETAYTAEVRMEQFHEGGAMEFHGGFSFMKTGILYSEIISTVSPTYAKEILTYEYGNGMNDILWPRRDDLYGILNGIDDEEWDPMTDKHLPFHYSAKDVANKAKVKEFLLKQTSISGDLQKPLIGIVSRMVGQKGFDLIEKALAELMLLDANWVILGSGEDQFEEMFRGLSQALPYKVWSYIGFSNELSHLVEAGSDMFLMPSRFEPCGLNQMYSLRYGTVPIVRKTGGLADTVWDWHELKAAGRNDGNGFTFSDANPYALFTTVHRAIQTYQDKKTWKAIQKNGMAKDHSWTTSAKHYVELYRKAIEKHEAQFGA